MKIRKRNGTEVDFNIEKIVRAISKANETVSPEQRLSEDAIRAIAEEIERDTGKVLFLAQGTGDFPKVKDKDLGTAEEFGIPMELLAQMKDDRFD